MTLNFSEIDEMDAQQQMGLLETSKQDSLDVTQKVYAKHFETRSRGNNPAFLTSDESQAAYLTVDPKFNELAAFLYSTSPHEAVVKAASPYVADFLDSTFESNKEQIQLHRLLSVVSLGGTLLQPTNNPQEERYKATLSEYFAENADDQTLSKCHLSFRPDQALSTPEGGVDFVLPYEKDLIQDVENETGSIELTATGQAFLKKLNERHGPIELQPANKLRDLTP